MRLHNRVVKAEFWSDGELATRFDIPGRMFYQGLWQLADDSGCLDDRPDDWKAKLFPMDTDMSVSRLEEYRDLLIRLGKVVRYFALGRPYLWLVNFAKHQSIDRPRPPGKDTAPLPPWIEWRPGSNRRGEYAIIPERLPGASGTGHDSACPGTVQDVSGTRPGQDQDQTGTRPGRVLLEPEPEPEPEPLPPNPPGGDEDGDPIRGELPPGIHTVQPGPGARWTNWYLRRTAHAPPPIMLAEIGERVRRGLDEDLVILALARAFDEGKENPLRWANTVTANWFGHGLRTVADLEQWEAEKQAAAARDQTPDGPEYTDLTAYARRNQANAQGVDSG